MDNLWANLRANLVDNLNWHFWGRHELYWPAYYLWPHEYVRPMHTDEQMERLGWWLVLSEHCGWWQPFEGVVFACEPPMSQTVDDAGRLHNESGPAMMCRDGWPVYAWHGVRVPAWVIERPEDITADKINQEPNSEVRRVMLERLGLERYLRTVDAKRIDAHDDGNLWLIEPPTEDDEPLKLLELTNWTDEPDGTRKKYIFSVPPDMERVLQAKAWKYRVEDGFYNPAIQT
uniref:DUF6745 domain-containing protein n=1 Tax=Nitrospira cf. moscoviensis SBR1015 TaxID=96242 RepID=UPI00117EEF7C|nr:hypothetical protein [Nitrospira cf. moscoviensis SBR1015]